MRVITANLNGIRSAADKGFFEWAAGQQADFIAVQETKAQADVIDGRFDTVGPGSGGSAPLRGAFAHAEKKGYSGVGLYSRHAPAELLVGLSASLHSVGTNDASTHRAAAEFDAEGRWVEMVFDAPGGRPWSVVSAYFPSGSSSPERQEAKFRFLALVGPHLRSLVATRDLLLLGDVNIAHQGIDLKNWKGNLKNSGFLPEERSWMSELLGGASAGPGLVDVYRRLHPTATEECYTWWSQRGQARANNVGWRIDYHLAAPALAERAQRAEVYRAQRFSDHAPVVVDYAPSPPV